MGSTDLTAATNVLKTVKTDNALDTAICVWNAKMVSGEKCAIQPALVIAMAVYVSR